MNNKKMKDELDKYKRQYKNIVNRNVQLENQFQRQEEKNQQLLNSLVECQKAVDMNKTLLRKFGEEHNRKENEMVDLMNRLKAKLREMGYNGNFNRLGNESN